jgi:hypothetical protein
VSEDDLSVIIPAFVIGELKEAFVIGFLVFLPFLVLDMLLANILLALGMQTLSPGQVALPFKILLFVAVDGWGLGKITVYRDAGTSALPSKAPTTTVNTDGRSYTVLYQNLLPQISVRWPNAPAAPSYTLTITSNGSSTNQTVSAASFSFAPGKLKEGQHAFLFRSSQGRSSRPAHATIRFDNAAPKASIMSPVEGGFGAGSSVRVSGIALPGWEVRARGAALPLDSEQRFSASVGAGQRGLVLQFSHPARGTHHYLRRAAGVPR